MVQANAVQATFERDVSGQVAIGKYITQITGDGNIVNNYPHPPSFDRRESPVDMRPAPFPSLLDRKTEVSTIELALQASTPLSLFGIAGVGKSSLLQQISYLPETNNFADGVVYLSVEDRGIHDLLQLLFDVFHTSPPGVKPTEGQILHDLHDIKALVLLDDLTLTKADAMSLRNVMPQSTLILASIERSFWGQGTFVELRGLPVQDAIALFERELGRPLDIKEKETVEVICNLLDCHPFRILEIASLTRDSGTSFTEIKNKLQGQSPVLTILQSFLTDSQQSILALLGAAGGKPVPFKHLTALLPGGNLQKELNDLIRLRWIKAHSPRYSLMAVPLSSITNMSNFSSWEDTLINYFVSWLEGEPEQALIEESAEALIYTVKRAGEKESWPEVIRLGRALERGLILWKRWQTWADILNLILKAAKALGDRKVEAWALHQLGSRAMCLGQADRARELLTEALNIRKAIKDRAGQALTQHNLNVLLRGSVPPKGGKSGGHPWLIGGSAMFIALLMSALIISGVLSQKSLDRLYHHPLQILTDNPIHIPFISTPPDTPSPVEIPTPTQSQPSPVPIAVTNLIPATGVTDTPTSTDTVTPTDTSGISQFITSTPSPTQAASETFTPTPSETQTPTETFTPTPSDTPTPIAQIVGVDCGTGLTLYVHIRITSESGISSYSVWSTWGGGGQIDQTFSPPLPTFIDEIIVHTHDILDPVDRQHEVGLKVTTPDSSQPIFAYALEPGGRCPGHYQAPTPTDTTPPPEPPVIESASADPSSITFPGCGLSQTTFTAVVIDNQGLASVTLRYQINNGPLLERPMVQTGNSTYQTTLDTEKDALPVPGDLLWFVEARDTSDLLATSDKQTVFLYDGCPR